MNLAPNYHGAISISKPVLGRVGHNPRRGPIHGLFGPSRACRVYFLRNSTEFYVMRAECQIIIFLFLLLISHKSPAISKPLPSSVFGPNI